MGFITDQMALIHMQRTQLTFFVFALIFATSLQAQTALNPMNWFSKKNKEVERFVIATNIDEAAATAKLEEGMAQLNAGNRKRAEKIFKRMIKDYPNAIATGEARYQRGRIQMSKGQWEKAFNTLQELVAKHPNYENFDQVIGAQFECATAHQEGARGKILWVFPGFKKYTIAIDEFEQIVRNAPYNDYAPLALMNIALIAEMLDDPDVAIDALDRLINYYPQSMLAPDAYANMAETYANLVRGPEYDQGSTRQAISYYEDFLILFPNSNYLGEVEADLIAMQDLLARSKLNLGDFYYIYRADNTAALVYYNETITLAPDSEAATEAREKIANIEAGVRPTSGASVLRKLLLAD